jgi:hypothetical protein
MFLPYLFCLFVGSFFRYKEFNYYRTHYSLQEHELLKYKKFIKNRDLYNETKFLEKT